MELKKLDATIREQLRKPFPPEAVKQHESKSFLSTIKAIYIVERLNDIFGLGRWKFEHEIIERTEDYITMKGTLTLIDYDAFIPSQFGGHTTVGKGTEIADGYKSAVTDALSKCASYIEIGIDIFKGLHDTAKNTPKSEDDNKPWMTSGQLSQLVSKIRGGDYLDKTTDEVLKMAREHFKVNKKHAEEITAEMESDFNAKLMPK